MSKGQAAMEFYIYLGMFMLALSIAMTIFLNVSATESQKYDAYAVEETAGRFVDIIHTSYVAGNGFNGTFDVPQKIGGKNFTIYIKAGSLILVSYIYEEEMTVFRPLSVRSINCLSCGGATDDFHISSDDMQSKLNIYNSNGSLIINY